MEENKLPSPPIPIEPEKVVNPDKGMSFEDYKREANLDDIKKLEYKLKPYWWENLPILGSMIYSIRIGIKLAGIDRGLLRKEIVKVRLIFMFATLIYIGALIMAITPWFNWWQYKIAIKRAHKKIIENDPIKV